jgi:hypothetical protein
MTRVSVLPRRGAAVVVVALAGLLEVTAAGCGDAEWQGGSDVDDVEASQQTLVQASDAGTWPGGGIKAHIIRQKLHVPETPENSLGDAEIEWLQDNVRRRFGETWGRAADVFLDFFETVATEHDVPNGELGIGVLPAGPGGNVPWLGWAADRPTLMVFSAPTPSPFLIIHELGHVLGFADNEGHGAENPTCSPQGPGDSLTPLDSRFSIMMNHSGCWVNPADPLQLSHWDEIGLRRLYGRKPAGMVVGVNNKCLDIPNSNTVSGQPLQTFSCHRGDAQTWRYFRSNDRLAANLTGASTMEVRGLTSATGTIVQAANPNGGLANQRWRFRNAAIKGFGGKCFEVFQGVFRAGQGVNLVDCKGTAAQRYEVEPVSTDGYRIRVSGVNLCVVPSGTGAGSGLRLGTCPGSATSAWFLSNHGSIRFGSRNGWCVNAAGSDPNVNPIGLRLAACVSFSATEGVTGQRQRFLVSGNMVNNLGTCLTGQDADFKDGTTTVTATCSQNRSSIWDYYWLQD